MGVVKSMNPNIKAHSFDNLLDIMVTADTRLDIMHIEVVVILKYLLKLSIMIMLQQIFWKKTNEGMSFPEIPDYYDDLKLDLKKKYFI